MYVDDNSNAANNLLNPWNSSHMSIPYRGDPHELAKRAADNYRAQTEEISKVKILYK